MSRRLRRSIVVLSAGLLAVFPLAAQMPPPLPLTEDTPAEEPEPVRRWLDEVRAQRQTRQERRRAAKEARDIHRRWIDPWVAARQEFREQETQRRHDVFIEHIERDREAFRNQVPWRPRPGPWQDEAPPPATPPRSLADDDAETVGSRLPQTSPYPLPGWNNRWYYRGY